MKRTIFHSCSRGAVLVALVTLIALSACTSSIPRTNAEVPRITILELKQEMESGGDFLVIDVRTTDEYLEGHIKGAVHVPNNRMNAMIPPEGKQLIFYCA